MQFDITKYKAHQSPNKEQARQHIIEQFKGGKVLSLSADNFRFETSLIDKNYAEKPTKVVCYEYNSKIYKNAKQNLKELQEKYPMLKLKFDNIFNANANKFDFIFLDLCGCFSTTMLWEIFHFFNGFKGTCFITVFRGRENADHFIPDYFGAVGDNRNARLQDFRDNIFHQLMKRYTDLELIDMFDYQSKTDMSNGSPMRVYGFTHPKNISPSV